MTWIDKLQREVALLRENAATFYKVDLHVHSHESHDFPKLSDKPNATKILSPEDTQNNVDHYVQHAKTVDDLRIIAITDHNVCRVATEIAQLGDADILVLPGMEVSVEATLFPGSTVHILTIFPESHASEDIEKVFPVGCGMKKYDDRDENSSVNISVADFIRGVHSAGGLCIAGHVNSNKGVRTLFRDYNVKQLHVRLKVEKLNALKGSGAISKAQEAELADLKKQVQELEDDMQNRYLQFVAKYEFDAIEVQKSSDHQYYSGGHTDALGIRPIACLLGSDAHCLADIGLKGSTTYVKMQQPRFKDLQRALRDPATRIRYEDTIPSVFPSRILGVKFGRGFFSEQTVGFSDNLTCLIGGRGSGKSATIEALRFAFCNQLTHLSSEKKSDISGRRDHTLDGSHVEILFVDSRSNSFILRREFGTNRTECYGLDGHRMAEVEVSTASNLDVDIYGWGELEELARNKREQLRLVDGFIGDVSSFKDAIQNATRNLADNTQQILKRTREIEGLLPQIDELPQLEAELARLSTEEIDAIFEGHDRNETARLAATAVDSRITELRTILIEADSGNPYKFNEILAEAAKEMETALVDYDWIGDTVKGITDLSAKAQKIYLELLQVFAELQTTSENTLDRVKNEKLKIEDQLHDSMDDNAKTELASAIRRRKELSSNVGELTQVRDKITALQSEVIGLLSGRHTQLIPQLDEERRTLSQLRKEKIEEINTRLSELNTSISVTLELTELGDRETFKEKLGSANEGAPDGLLKGVNRHYKRDNYAGLYTKKHDPHTFVKAILEPGDFQALCLVGADGETKLSKDKAEAVAKHLSPYLPDTDGGTPHGTAG